MAKKQTEEREEPEAEPGHACQVHELRIMALEDVATSQMALTHNRMMLEAEHDTTDAVFERSGLVMDWYDRAADLLTTYVPDCTCDTEAPHRQLLSPYED